MKYFGSRLVRCAFAALAAGLPVLGAAQNAWYDGWYVATYAFHHTWDGSIETGKDDCAAFASRAERAGGWQYVYEDYPWERTWSSVWYDPTASRPTRSYTWAGADNFENFLNISGRAELTEVVTPTQTRMINNNWIEPGDLIVADWGDGKESEPPYKNKACVFRQKRSLIPLESDQSSA